MPNVNIGPICRWFVLVAANVCYISAFTNKIYLYDSEIEQTSAEIVEEIEKCKESVLVRSKVLEEEKENLQRAALAVLQIFNPDAI